jgi:hypothetical protein
VEHEQKKANLLKLKLDVDQRLANLKSKRHKASMLAKTRGLYMDPKKFAHLENRIESLKQESQQIQLQLSLLKLERRQSNETPQGETRAGGTPHRVKAAASSS